MKSSDSESNVTMEISRRIKVFARNKPLGGIKLLGDRKSSEFRLLIKPGLNWIKLD